MRKRLGALLVCGIAAFLPLVCAGCVFSKEEPQVMHTHTWVEDRKVAPTCVEQGYTIYVCVDDPTHTMRADFVPVDHEAHKWKSDVNVVKPTYVRDGYTEYTCEYNPAHKKRENPVTLTQYRAANPTENYDGHKWVAQETVAPTCVAQGYTVYRCAYWDTLSAEEKENYDYEEEFIKEDDFVAIDPDAHEWVAVGDPVLPTCIEDGYTPYECAHDHTHTKHDDAVTLAEYLVDNPTYDGYGWEAVGTVDPTCSTLGYTIYEGKYSRDYIADNPAATEFPNGTAVTLYVKHDNFVDVLPDEPENHGWSGFAAYPEGAANADHPTILRDTCADSIFSGDGTAPTYCIMPDDLRSEYYSDATPLPPYYVSSEEHHRYIYETANMPIGTAGAQVPAANAINWFNLPIVPVDTFVEFSRTVPDAAISLYEFDAETAADKFTKEQDIIAAVTPVEFLNDTLYVTLRAGKIYFVKVSAPVPAAGNVSVTKILETDTEMLENLLDSGVTAITNDSNPRTYSFADIIKFSVANGDEIIVSHSKNDWTANVNRTKDGYSWRDKYKYTKIYRYGEDVFTFAIAMLGTDVSQGQYDSLMWVIETVLSGFELSISAPDEYYVWAFYPGVGGNQIGGYYGVEEVVIIPSGITSIINGSIGSFFDNQSIREIIFAQPYTITRIGAGAFQNCRGLEVLELPTTVTQVGNNAFLGCGSLKFVYYHGAYPGITINPVGNTDLTDNVIYYSEAAPTPVGNEKYWHYNNNNERVIWNNGSHEITFKSLGDTVGLSYEGTLGSVILGKTLTEYAELLSEPANAVFQHWYYILEAGGVAYEVEYTDQRISGAIRDMTFYAKYKSSYEDFGLFDTVDGVGASTPIAEMYPAVNRFQHTGSIDGGTLKYYLYFDEGECAAAYYPLLQSLYGSYTHIVAYRFGAEIFLAYGNGAVAIDMSIYKGQTVPTEEYNKASDYYPLPDAFGNIRSYIAKLFGSWSPTLLAEENSVGYLPTSMDFKFKVIEDSISSARLLIVNIGAEDGTQMEDLLTYNLSKGVTEVMREGEYLFMLINTTTVASSDLADTLGITWDDILDKVGLLPPELRGYYGAINTSGNYTDLDIVIGDGIKSISFTDAGMTMTVTISSGGLGYFNTLTPNNQYITLFDELVFTFTPTLNGMLVEEQINELRAALSIIDDWDNNKNGGTVAVLTEAEYNVAVNVASIGYYDPNRTIYSSGNTGIKYSAILETVTQVEPYGAVHTMEFYIYDNETTAADAVSVLSVDADVDGVYRKGNIVLVYKNVTGGGILGLTAAEALEMLVDRGEQSLQMPPMKGVVCDNYGDKSGVWDDFIINLP